MRKVAAALCVLFAVAGAIWVLALPAPAGPVNPYPPIVTTTTTGPPPTTLSPTTTTTSPTPTTAPSGTTTTTQAGPTVITVPGRLAFTGSDSKPYVVAGIIALTVGAMAIVATHRRNAVRARKLDR